MRKLLTTIALLASAAAHASYMSGNDLLSKLNEQTGSFNRGVAGGYIVGVHDMGQGIFFCPPPGVTIGQITDMTRVALESMPQERHKSADLFVIRALSTAWPCPKQGKGTSL